jgi:tetratricopeptide (TPR) repeat protein
MKHFVVLMALVLCCSYGFSQTSPADKKKEKAMEYVKANKLEDADKYLEGVLEKNPEYGNCWDLLVKIRLKFYKDAKDKDKPMNFTITTTRKDSSGKDVKVENDTLANQFTDLLNKYKPSRNDYCKFVYTMRKAVMSTNDALESSIYLRSYLIDVEIDTNVSKKALNYFNEAEKQFAKKNLADAGLLYKQALEEQPDFYKAKLYLGDTYYGTGDYVEATNVFKEATERFPFLLEPIKYLTDAYSKQKLHDKALQTAITAMAIYPDYNMMQKIDDLAFANQKKLDIKWTARKVFPNHIDNKSENFDFFTYEDKKKIEVKTPWTFYKKAQDKIKDYCDDKGIITKTNSLTQSKYLEVYSWEEMLANSKDPSLDEARRMQTDGYLDCYVLVTCYHYDFYDQYLDFASKNKDRILAYYNKYIKTL